MFLAAILVLLFVSALLAIPLTFLGMLFLGNIGHPYGFLDLLPGAIALKILAASVSSAATTK